MKRVMILSAIIIFIIIISGCVVVTDDNEVEVTVTEYGDLTGLWEAGDAGALIADNRLRIQNESGKTITKVTYSLSTNEPNWSSLASTYNIVPNTTASIADSAQYDFSIGPAGDIVMAIGTQTIWLKIICSDDKYYVSSFTFDTVNNLDEWWLTLYEKNDY